MYKIRLRPAIAMIELIFAIVVMGIVMMSAPMLISTAAKSTGVALQQEGINEAAARVNMIMTYDWDENNVNVPCKDNPSILHTQSTSADLENENIITKKRPGVSANTLGHTYDCSGEEYDATAVDNLGKEGNRTDDIDDFIGTSSLVMVNTGDGGVDYLEQDTVSIQTKVAYINDDISPSNYSANNFFFSLNFAQINHTTNVKSIIVTLKSTNSAEELAKEITLRAFSCNIGSYHYYTGKMP